jgi:hypothetical protein
MVRGIFNCLPVLCSNDLVHGCWWFVWGSFFSMLIPVAPAVDLAIPIFKAPHVSVYPIPSDQAAWCMLLLSGFVRLKYGIDYFSSLPRISLKTVFCLYNDNACTCVIFVCMHVCIYVFMLVCVCVCVCVCMLRVLHLGHGFSCDTLRHQKSPRCAWIIIGYELMICLPPGYFSLRPCHCYHGH